MQITDPRYVYRVASNYDPEDPNPNPVYDLSLTAFDTFDEAVAWAESLDRTDIAEYGETTATWIVVRSKERG